MDGLDYEDIADKLQVNVNTLRVNLSRGRKMVREQLMKLNYEPARS
ncbi:MAG: sigma factor-like helix-turn-helix DNA-binding protein [Bacteroidales bacterium]